MTNLLDTPTRLGLSFVPMAVTQEEIKRVMSALGKKGGKSRSPKKVAAARRNGKAAGRRKQRQ